MRILVDYRPALRARTGVGEYFHELVRAYTGLYADEVTVFTSSWKDRPAPDLADRLHARVVDRRVPVRVLNYLWHRREWPAVEQLAGRCDVVHAAHPLLIPAREAAQVVTIHDLFFLSNPEGTRAEIRRDYPALTGDHARRAHAIVTPSSHVRQQVAKRFDVPADRIHACPPGAPSWQRLGAAPNVPDDGYILFVGTLEPRKNLDVLLDAYEHLLRRSGRVPALVVAGGAHESARGWLDRMARPPLAGRAEYRGYVSDTAREDLYAGARLLVLPSFDEGFGLPALEAMSAGVPVIAANRGALPEVVGDAGALVDAEDAHALADAIAELVDDRALALARAGAGLARARTFTWQRTAGLVREAYVAAAARRHGAPA